MANPSKRRGTYFETRIVEWLQARGYDASRNPQAGKLDKGDVRGVAGWTLELKNRRGLTLAQFMDEAKREHEVGKTSWFAVIANRARSRLERAYVIMELGGWEQLINYVRKLEVADKWHADQHYVKDRWNDPSKGVHLYCVKCGAAFDGDSVYVRALAHVQLDRVFPNGRVEKN